MTTTNADTLLSEAARTDARQGVPLVALLSTPLVPPDGWAEIRPAIERRLKLGIAQGEVAGAANSTSTRICELERGRRRVTPHWIERYCNAVDRCAEALKEQRRQKTRERIDTSLPWVKE